MKDHKSTKTIKEGDRISKLTILSIDTMGRRKKAYCVCDCGKEKRISLYCLVTNQTKSCGCLRGKDHTLNSPSVRANNILSISLPRGESAFNNLYRSIRNHALNRKLDFPLSKKEVREITSKDCFYCSEPPKYIKNSGAKSDTGVYIYNGIDRLNNKKGYNLDNCVPCCRTCNFMKRDFDFNLFIEKCRLISLKHSNG